MKTVGAGFSCKKFPNELYYTVTIREGANIRFIEITENREMTFKVRAGGLFTFDALQLNWVNNVVWVYQFPNYNNLSVREWASFTGFLDRYDDSSTAGGYQPGDSVIVNENLIFYANATYDNYVITILPGIDALLYGTPPPPSNWYVPKGKTFTFDTTTYININGKTTSIYLQYGIYPAPGVNLEGFRYTPQSIVGFPNFYKGETITPTQDITVYATTYSEG